MTAISETERQRSETEKPQIELGVRLSGQEKEMFLQALQGLINDNKAIVVEDATVYVLSLEPEDSHPPRSVVVLYNPDGSITTDRSPVTEPILGVIESAQDALAKISKSFAPIMETEVINTTPGIGSPRPQDSTSETSLPNVEEMTQILDSTESDYQERIRRTPLTDLGFSRGTLEKFKSQGFETVGDLYNYIGDQRSYEKIMELEGVTRYIYGKLSEKLGWPTANVSKDLGTPIERLNPSVRAFNGLKSVGIYTVEQISSITAGLIDADAEQALLGAVTAAAEAQGQERPRFGILSAREIVKANRKYLKKESKATSKRKKK
jgi:hypothetical protein